MVNPTEITIDAGGPKLQGDLVLPQPEGRLVVFAHGSGSSRFSPRNQAVAARLHDAGLGTMLFDLLAEEEVEADRRDGHLRFNIPLLGGRLGAVVDALDQDDRTPTRPIGLFGASTGAAAALVAASERPQRIGAVVSRGGRPDLAGDALDAVAAPTLLIVGSADYEVLDLNRQAARRLGDASQIETVEGATHLFEEPGALERVADLAADWFVTHLVTTESPIEVPVPDARERGRGLHR